MYHGARCFTIQSILFFPVARVTEAGSDGQIYSSLIPLEVNSISLATGYEFKHENQSIYLSKDMCEFTPRRQWPNITLPVLASAPPSQLLWVQTHSSSGPCKQPMIRLRTSCGHKAQTPVLSTRRSRWSISLIMWKVATKSARCVTRSCLQPKS